MAMPLSALAKALSLILGKALLPNRNLFYFILAHKLFDNIRAKLAW